MVSGSPGPHIAHCRSMNLLKMLSDTFHSHKPEAGTSPAMSLDMFMINEKNNMGVGGFGTVCSAMFVKNRVWYAIKEVNKVMSGSYECCSLL